MRLLYLASVRLPTENAHGVQIMKTCEAFADEGTEVELVITKRKTSIQEDAFSYYDVRKNFTITCLSIPNFIWAGKIGFLFSMLIFSEAVKWRKNFYSADIIYSRDAFILLQYLLLGRKLVYEAHTKPTLISTFVAKRVYRLVVISEGLRDVYIKKGVSKEKIIVAHDAVDVVAFKENFGQSESRKWLGIPEGKKVALYVGKIDYNKGVDTFAKASEYSDEIQFVAVGEGPQLKEFKTKYPKTLFLPATPYRNLPRVLSSGDVLVIPNSALDEDSSLYTSPLKAFAYMATGKPIVASDVPALGSILSGASFFKPDDCQGCVTAIKHAMTLKIVEHTDLLSWKSRAENIIKKI